MVKFEKQSISSGFGLVELIVSLSIVTIVTGIVVARHNTFNGAILLRNQAYEIAFVIKEAQQLAVSGSQTETLTTTKKQRYGVAFSTLTGDDANKQSIVLYKDNNTNGIFDSGTDVEIKTYRLDSRFEITDLKTDSTSRNNVRVLFERPFFDAHFYPNSNGPVQITVSPVGKTSPQRVINVSSSGQIMVESN